MPGTRPGMTESNNVCYDSFVMQRIRVLIPGLHRNNCTKRRPCRGARRRGAALAVGAAVHRHPADDRRPGRCCSRGSGTTTTASSPSSGARSRSCRSLRSTTCRPRRPRSCTRCSAEYLSFIVLLFALYVVAGGILVTGNLRGTPLVNTAILAFGTLIASDRRHHRRRHDPDPAAAARQCQPAAQRARGGVLHHPGRQCRRRADARSAIRRCSSASCAASSSSGPRSTCGCRQRSSPRIVLAMFVVVDVWFYRQDQRVTLVGEPPPPPARARRAGQHQFPAARAASSPRSCSTSQWKPGIAFDIYGTKVQLQELLRDAALIADRVAFARAHAQRAPREPTASPGSRSAKSRSCSPASSPASCRCWRCCRRAAPARSAGCRS